VDLNNCSKYNYNYKVKEEEMAGYVARMEKRNAYRVLMGKPEGNTPLKTPRRRWVNKINMDRTEI
jgi:hypothetical protein